MHLGTFPQRLRATAVAIPIHILPSSSQRVEGGRKAKETHGIMGAAQTPHSPRQCKAQGAPSQGALSLITRFLRTPDCPGHSSLALTDHLENQTLTEARRAPLVYPDILTQCSQLVPGKKEPHLSWTYR